MATALAILVFCPAAAQSPKRTVAPSTASEYFIDLKDGAHVPLKLHLRLGLNNMGVAPAGVDFPVTGHHHIIVDAPLPAFDRPIPNDDNHIHLGAGQTEVDLNLAPGPHTLQLMMADKGHIPHDPPVHSPVIHVLAERPRAKALADAGCYFITPRSGSRVSDPITVRFGLHGMGVAPTSVTTPNTGHHNLVVDADPPDAALPFPTDDMHRSFPDGETETSLTLPPGKHTLQLVFTDRGGLNFDPPIQSDKITVMVRPAKPERR